MVQSQSIPIESLMATSMRLDWTEATYAKWARAGLPLDRLGATHLLGLSVGEPDALDILWLFELLSADAGLALARKYLPVSPLNADGQDDARTYGKGSLNELRELRGKYDATERGIRYAGGTPSARHAAAAHKHFAAAFAGREMAQDSRRIAVHLAKSVHHSLAIKYAACGAALRQSLYGDFWDVALLAVATEWAIVIEIPEMVESQAI